MRRRGVTAGLLAALLAPGVGWAQGAGYPDRAVRLVVPWPAGGAADLLARLVAGAMRDGLGQPVAVENRPGARGALGADLVARAAPDGHALLLADAGTFARARLDPASPFDPERDLSPVGPLGDEALAVVGRGDLPGTLADVLEAARRAPGRLNLASAGVGSVGHLAGARLLRQAGVRATHVAYRGPGPALRDLAAGRVDLFLDTVPALLGPLGAGRLRGLAVTGAARSALLAGLPTVAEAALPGFSACPWWGIAGPAGMPAEAVTRLSAELRHVLGEPALRRAMAGLGVRALAMSPAEFADHVREEDRRWALGAEEG